MENVSHYWNNGSVHRHMGAGGRPMGSSRRAFHDELDRNQYEPELAEQLLRRGGSLRLDRHQPGAGAHQRLADQRK